MAYIGKEPQVGNYVKLDAITTSSTNTYNLTQDSVAFVPESALHMLVSLNGVIQSPLSSFSVSGSTITFLPSSGTLSSSDTIDFILVLGNTLDIGTPSDSTVTNAKTNFVSTSSSAGLQIKGDGTTDGTLQLNCSQNSHGIKLASPAHSAGQSYTLKFPTGNLTAGNLLKINSISGSGATAVGQLEAPSELTLPNQPTCHVQPTSTILNFGQGGYTVAFDNEIYDVGSNFDSTNYQFIAPVTGKYLVNFSIYAQNVDTASAYYEAYINTSNRDYYTGTLDPNFSSDVNYFNFQGSAVCDLDTGDSAKIIINQSGGTVQTDIATGSFINVTLIC